MLNVTLRCSARLAGIFIATVVIGGSISSAADPEVQSIHETYAAWVEAANDRDIAKWSAFLSDDPYFVPPDSPPLTSTTEVIDYYSKSFSDEWFSLDCVQEQVELSESGDMAWARGVCNATFTGPDGEKATGTSRWFKVWMKQPDGSWRGRVNTWQYVDQR
jgi:ketosteroid isomerase-like protein